MFRYNTCNSFSVWSGEVCFNFILFYYASLVGRYVDLYNGCHLKFINLFIKMLVSVEMFWCDCSLDEIDRTVAIYFLFFLYVKSMLTSTANHYYLLNRRKKIQINVKFSYCSGKHVINGKSVKVNFKMK